MLVEATMWFRKSVTSWMVVLIATCTQQSDSASCPDRDRAHDVPWLQYGDLALMSEKPCTLCCTKVVLSLMCRVWLHTM